MQKKAQKKRALVTGGAGFIGSHLVDALIAREWQVTVIDDLSTGVLEQVNRKATFVRLDIRNTDLEECVLRARPSVVFHCAAQIDARQSVIDPAFDAEVNVVGSLRLLEASRKAGVKKFIFSSSGGAIYGGATTIPTPESCIPKPFSPYGASKLSFEHYLHCYRHVYGFDSVVLRYANVYGPRQSGHGEAGVVAVFIRKLLHGEQPVINGDGEQTRDFVYVDDVVSANLRALTKKVTSVCNIGTGIETSINTLFHQLVALTKADVPEMHTPAKLGEERRSVLDNGLAKELLDWNPKVALGAGLKKTLTWFKPRIV